MSIQITGEAWRSFPHIIHAADVAPSIAPGNAWLSARVNAESGRGPMPGDMLVYTWQSGDPPEIGGESYSVFLSISNEWSSPFVLGEI